MIYMLLRTAAPLVTVAMLLGSAGVAAASSEEGTPLPADGPSIVLDDGTAIGPNDSITFTFQGDRPEPEGDVNPLACPEVNDPPTYTVRGTPQFMPDTRTPQSTWLLPRQSVSWAVTGSHTFNASITGGVEAEAGAIITKAKVSIDTTIGRTWTWTGTKTVTDTNSTATAYRAVLGTVGWRLTGVKKWIAAPCNVKTKTIVVTAPRRGDMSIGRQNS